MPVVTRGPPTPLAKQSQRVGEVGVPRWSCLCHEAHSTGRRAAFCTLCSFRPSSLRSSTASVTSYTTLKPKPKASCSSRRLRGCPGSAPRTCPRLNELGFGLDVEGFRDQRNLVARFGLRSAAMSCSPESEADRVDNEPTKKRPTPSRLVVDTSGARRKRVSRTCSTEELELLEELDRLRKGTMPQLNDAFCATMPGPN